MNASADGKRNQAVCPGIMRQRRTISAYDYPGEPPGQPKTLSHQDCCSTGPRVFGGCSIPLTKALRATKCAIQAITVSLVKSTVVIQSFYLDNCINLPAIVM